MPSFQPFDMLPGAYATPRMVGRKQQLQQLRDAIGVVSDRPRVVAILADGGIGKSRLLREFLVMAARIQQESPDRGLIVVRDPIDGYHMSAHTEYGLADAIQTGLADYIALAPEFANRRTRIEQMMLAGDASGAATLRDEAVAKFEEFLSNLTVETTVLVALDTVERLLYSVSPRVPLVQDRAESWRWLMRLLPSLHRVVVVLAGRTEASPLIDQLDTVLGRQGVIRIELPSLSEDESLEYFREAAQAARDHGQPIVAQRIEQLPAETRHLAHIYSGGRPIFLALLADLVALANPLPAVLRIPLAEARRRSAAEIKTIAAELEEQLVNRLIESTGCGETILALGRAPKGADAKLLSELLRPELSQIEHVKELSITKIREASAVADRPQDNRFLLHDEMYRILDDHVYSKPSDAPAAARSAKAIRGYYRQELRQCAEEMQRLYTTTPSANLKENQVNLSRVRNRRLALQTEYLYYRLRQNPHVGFRYYYRYSREAARAGDVALDYRLEAEMLEFLEAAEKSARGSKVILQGVDRDHILGDIAIRPVVRAFARGDSQKALDAGQQIRSEGASYLQAGGGVIAAELSVWEAYAMVYLGGEDRTQEAHQKLDETLDTLRPLCALTKKPDALKADQWHRLATLAFAYHVRGYLHRVLSEMPAAIADYKRAAHLWRRLNVLVELAGVLNDLGFALAEQGEFDDAADFVNDALNQRNELGIARPIGLSLNTLAHIELRQGNFDAAIQHAGQARSLFSFLNDQRGKGLALIAYAEALRRHADTNLVPEATAKQKNLEQARDLAQEAVTIFTSKDSSERSRAVEALIEVGCACRNLVQVHSLHGRQTGALATEADNAFTEAAKLAGDTIRHRKIDALVNRAWLGFYTANHNLLATSGQQAEEAVPADHVIDVTKGKPPVAPERAQVLLWMQLGKLHMLYGHHYLEAFEDLRIDQPEKAMKSLSKASEEYALALEYDSLFDLGKHGHHSRSLQHRRAEQGIYDKLKEFEADELEAVRKAVIDTEHRYHLGRSAMRAFLVRRMLWARSVM